LKSLQIFIKKKVYEKFHLSFNLFVMTQSSKSLKLKNKENPVSSFIRKTYNILEEKRFPEVIDWNEEGTALMILKPKEFCSKVLPKYFKHSQLTSFVRQLNLYNFHKRRTLTTEHVYYHDMFQRGEKELLINIHRKSQDQTLLTLQKAIESTKSGESIQSPQSLNYENRILLMMHKEALQRISTLDAKMKDLTIQNQALWNQISQQDEREAILQNLVNSIISEFNIPVDELLSLVRTSISSPTTNKALAQEGPNCTSCIDVGCFLDLEASCDSTENSSFPSLLPSSSIEQINLENEKSVDSRDESALIIKLLNNVQKRSAPDEEKKKDHSLKNTSSRTGTYSSQDWNLESEYLRKFANNKDKFESLFGNGQVNQQTTLGKRGYDFEKSNTNTKLEFEDEEENFLSKIELPRKLEPIRSCLKE